MDVMVGADGGGPSAAVPQVDSRHAAALIATQTRDGQASAALLGQAPSAWVAQVRERLAEVDMGVLSDRERVDLVAELERLKGAASAGQARATHAVRCSRELTAPRDVARSVGSEIALARRESPTLGDRFVGLARALVAEMPCTMRALTAGECSERHALVLAQATACLSVQDRGAVDRRVGPLLGRLGVGQAERAAKRVAAELDAASVVRRMEAAVRSRRVTVRPAPDGMAYLSVLGPMKDVVGAQAALLARSRGVVGGQCPDEAPEGRGVGAVAADTALRLLSGREVGQVQPVEVHLVMTDRSLLGTGNPDRSVMEPGRVPGHGPVPAPVAREWVREADRASVWLRRLYTTPDGRDLVGMDSRRRLFAGLLRRMLVLRDDVCTTPWCGAPIAHADHATPAREGGATTFHEGNGKCARCNLVKEAPGWQTRVRVDHPTDRHRHRGPEPEREAATSAALGPRRLTESTRVGALAEPPGQQGRGRRLRVRTPLGRVHESQPPPVLGWGSEIDPAAGSEPPSLPAVPNPSLPVVQPVRSHMSQAAPMPAVPAASVPAIHPQTPSLAGGPDTWVPGRKRPCRRPRATRGPALRRRPRLASHLERELCRLLV